MQTIPIVNEKTGRKFNSCKESGFGWGKKSVSGSVTYYNNITEKELIWFWIKGKQLQKAYFFIVFTLGPITVGINIFEMHNIICKKVP